MSSAILFSLTHGILCVSLRPMKLDAYLRAQNESEGRFGLRAGIQQPTVHRIRKGALPRVDMAIKIRDATRDQPTDDGGTVEIEDLVPAVQG